VTQERPRPGDYLSVKTLPSPAQAMPSGRFAALKIIEVGETGFAFAVLDGTWAAPPILRDARCAAILKRRAFKTSPNAVIDDDVYRSWWWAWRPDLLPEARLLGNDRITDEEDQALRRSISFTGIAHAATSAEREWRWRHDRKAFLEDVERSKAAHAAAAAAAAQRKRDRFKTLTWDLLLAEDPFPGWGTGSPPHPPEVFAAEARAVIHDACRALKDLGPRPHRKAVRVILRRCIDWFNDADARDGVIETEERERILAVVEEMAELAGQGELIGEIDVWRNW